VNTDETDDERFMREALREARVASARGEVPVGAVLVDRAGAIVARAHNLRETLEDPTAHAELLALRWAAMDLRSWRLSELTLFVTLEPCPMCAGALVNARIPRVVWGCDDPKAGAVRTLYAIGQDPRLNHRFDVRSGVLAELCADELRRFFRALRARKDR
jgi:tRNA(adenine34) deaminase